MDIVVERCAGLDVHKDTVVACVRTPGDGRRREETIVTFGTTTVQLLALRDWLMEMGVTADHWLGPLIRRRPLRCRWRRHASRFGRSGRPPDLDGAPGALSARLPSAYFELDVPDFIGHVDSDPEDPGQVVATRNDTRTPRRPMSGQEAAGLVQSRLHGPGSAPDGDLALTQLRRSSTTATQRWTGRSQSASDSRRDSLRSLLSAGNLLAQLGAVGVHHDPVQPGLVGWGVPDGPRPGEMAA
jgi:hypothetical protein